MTWSGEGFAVREAAGVSWLSAGVLASVPRLRHAFTLRPGGVSPVPWASLNLGGTTGDEPGRVAVNRARAWEAPGFGAAPVLPRQVHGNGILVLDAASLDAVRADPPEADGVVTALRGVPIAVLTADCPSVIICDTATPAIGVVHAGWRGMVQAAVWKALLTMFDAFGSRSEDCVAAIGPCIRAACYEVGEDVRTAFAKGLPYGQDLLVRAPAEGKWLADLSEAGRRQLLDGRLVPSRISACPVCTHCDAERFYSVRRDGARTGRQATVAMLDA